MPTDEAFNAAFDFSGPLIVIAIVAGVLLLPYLLAPVLVWWNFSLPATPRLEPVSADPNLPSEAPDFARFVASLEPELRAEGFRAAGAAVQRGKVESRYALFLSGDGLSAAVASMTHTVKGETRQMQSAFLEFLTRFADGLTIATNNCPEPPVLPAVGGRTVSQLPSVTSALALHRLHSAARNRFGSGAPIPVPVAPTLDLLAGSIRQACHEQVASGYLKFDAGTDAFRVGFGSAALMAWKLLEPWKSARKRALLRAERERLMELGVPAKFG